MNTQTQSKTIPQSHILANYHIVGFMPPNDFQDKEKTLLCLEHNTKLNFDKEYMFDPDALQLWMIENERSYSAFINDHDLSQIEGVPVTVVTQLV